MNLNTEIMRIKGIDFSIKQIVCLALYYSIGRYWPHNRYFLGGGQLIRYELVRRIFKYCGKNVNVEYGANFGSGRDIEIGDNSGLGINCCIPSNTKLGANVMMGPNCYILAQNHAFDRKDIPMIQQGFSQRRQTIIEDDVWIGRNVTMTPGRTIKKGTIVAACTVLTKDFPEYSIIGGNPVKLIRYR